MAELSSQLEHNTKKINNVARQLNKYENIGSGTFLTIREAFPNVTLEEVQLLNANATLDDTDASRQERTIVGSDGNDYSFGQMTDREWNEKINR